MPEYVVYFSLVRTGKHTHKIRNTPILSFHETPVDWQDLKRTLLDTARKIYFEFDHQTVSEISIQLHKSGKYKRASIGYRQGRLRIGIEIVFRARITFSHNQDTVKVVHTAFISPEFYAFKSDYQNECGRKWEIPKVIPSGFEASLRDQSIIFHDLLNLKRSSYMAQSKNLYGSVRERRHQPGLYSGVHHGEFYAGRKSTVDEDKSESDNEI